MRTPRPADLPSPFRRLPRRSARRELLDGPGAPAEVDLQRSLAAMGRVNRWLGGVRSLAHHLEPLVRDHSDPPVSLLDVGVGGGDVPRELCRRLRRQGIDARWTGLDLSLRVLGVAATTGRKDEPGRPRLVQGDGLRLPFDDRSVDVVLSTLTVHHLEEPSALRFLEEAGRVARLAVLVSDLERHPLHYLGARVLAATWWRSDPVTRYDGPVSVLRSFTAAELQALADRLSYRRATVHRHPPFRLVLVGRP